MQISKEGIMENHFDENRGTLHTCSITIQSFFVSMIKVSYIPLGWQNY